MPSRRRSPEAKRERMPKAKACRKIAAKPVVPPGPSSSPARKPPDRRRGLLFAPATPGFCWSATTVAGYDDGGSIFSVTFPRRLRGKSSGDSPPMTTPPDTDELLRRTAAGDADARNRLLARHCDRLRQMVAVR